MGFLIEIALRIFINVLNQFTKQDLNEFVEQFPKEVGQKIGEAVKGNLAPIKSWLGESTANLTFFISAMNKKKVKNELLRTDDRLNEISELIDAILKGIQLIKKPILIKEIFGNTNYYSFWQVEGYIQNAYNKTALEITPNHHFTVLLINSKEANYERLTKYISNTQHLPKRLIKKSQEVKAIHPATIITSSNKIWNKWINKTESIPLNFSMESYLNQLVDIEKNIELTIKKKSFIEKIKSWLGVS